MENIRPEQKKTSCRGCENYIEEYNYSICIRDKNKPKILPNDEGFCIEVVIKDINEALKIF